MIQHYAYRLKGSQEILVYGQCDELDFKNFWRKMRDKIDMAHVHTDDADYIYYTNGYKGKWATLHKKPV